MKKYLVLFVACVLCAVSVRAEEDWISERLEACRKGADDWACRHFEESYAKKTTVKKTTITETLKEEKPKTASSKPKITATIKNRPHETEVGDTLVNDFEPLADSDWIVRRVKDCEAKGEDDWACRHYKKVLAEARADRGRIYQEQLQQERRQRLLEQQARELEARQKAEKEAAERAEAERLKREAEAEAARQAMIVRQEELQRQKEAQEKAERERIQRENELRKKAEEIIEKRVKESKSYQKLSEGEERKQEDRILSEYYKLKLNHKNEGIQEKINWLEENQKNL